MTPNEVRIIGEINNEDLNNECRNMKEEALDGLNNFDFEIQYGIGTKGENEAIDRTRIIVEQIDTLLLSHPTICNRGELCRLARIAQIFLLKMGECIGVQDNIPRYQILRMVK